ncbi:MAG: ISAs1 family transposase, partial [Mycobacterium sp.]
AAESTAEKLASFGLTGGSAPDESTLRKLFARLDADALDRTLGAWMWTRTVTIGRRRVIALDGKTVRGARTRPDGKAPHLVAAFDHGAGAVLGQVAVDAKSNEIPAARTLLGHLDLDGAVVTLDAMHTQTDTATTITGAGGDYVFTVKANMPTLMAGLFGERKGPKRKSKLTDDTVATIRRLRDGGASYRTIATETGVSLGSIRNALKHTDTDTDTDTEGGCSTTDSDASASPEPAAEPDAQAVDRPVPVLADPAPRGAERALAAFGLIPYAPPVFTACARAPLAGLFLALPGLAATGLLDCAHTVYGAFPNGFYSLDTMLCENVFRALLGEARAEGATRIDPTALGRILGLDRAPEVKTIRRKIALLAAAGKAGDWITAMAARHVQDRPEQAAVCYVDGHVRAYQGTRKIAKTHVPRLKFPAPATVETWVCDAAGDPLLVVMAPPGASLASELRRLIPDLRAMVGDARRVLVGFDRGGWSPALFADLHAAGFDTLTWRKGPIADLDEALFTEHTHTDERGRTHTWALADTEVTLDIADGPRKGEVFAMRQISLHDTAATRQMHILTTRRDLPAAQIRYRMGSRWR